MRTYTKAQVTYLHRYDYRERNEYGTWTEPETRYHNEADDEQRARHRHEECKDVEHKWDHEFEGSWGYSWKNCHLVRRTRIVTVLEEEI